MNRIFTAQEIIERAMEALKLEMNPEEIEKALRMLNDALKQWEAE